jgi:hypothetical protein
MTVQDKTRRKERRTEDCMRPGEFVTEDAGKLFLSKGLRMPQNPQFIVLAVSFTSALLHKRTGRRAFRAMKGRQVTKK